MIEITLTVKSTNHGGETVITKTAESLVGNPKFEGGEVRVVGLRLTQEIAAQLDKLSG